MDSRSTGQAPRILGITGPIGCGKTAVGDILFRLGALEYIDADVVVHHLMAAASPTTAKIAHAFGDEVLRPDASVDRKRLAGIVFRDREQLKTLEEIIHPAARAEIRKRIGLHPRRDGVIVIDAIKLLQSDLLQLVDEVWVVRCSPHVQMQRLKQIRGMTEADALARIRAQPVFEHPAVTVVVDNSGTMQDLERDVKQAWQRFNQGAVSQTEE